jgi:hypothetical protein
VAADPWNYPERLAEYCKQLDLLLGKAELVSNKLMDDEILLEDLRAKEDVWPDPKVDRPRSAVISQLEARREELSKELLAKRGSELNSYLRDKWKRLTTRR